LTEVSQTALLALPEDASLAEIEFGPIKLLGYEINANSPFAEYESIITFYWQALEPVQDALHVYTRWRGEQFNGKATGQHPANNFYPTVAWEPGEIVADAHSLLRPQISESQLVQLQVAWAPAFTSLDELNWQTVISQNLDPTIPARPQQHLRTILGPLFINNVYYDAQIRPGSELLLTVTGFGANPEPIEIELIPVDPTVDREKQAVVSSGERLQRVVSKIQPPFIISQNLDTNLTPGTYKIMARYPGSVALCGWMAAESHACKLGEVEVSGTQLPEEAVNFDDKIALLEVKVNEDSLQPGGLLPIDISWQSLTQMEEDFTVFVQVLDAEDKIVGQVDSWPLQGTFPTSQWQPGEFVEDPYLVQLDANVQPGQYRVIIGWYLLETLRRLPVINSDGTAVDDKVVISGLTIP
jgi:hypothetical protein